MSFASLASENLVLEMNKERKHEVQRENESRKNIVPRRSWRRNERRG